MSNNPWDNQPIIQYASQRRAPQGNPWDNQPIIEYAQSRAQNQPADAGLWPPPGATSPFSDPTANPPVAETSKQITATSKNIPSLETVEDPDQPGYFRQVPVQERISRIADALTSLPPSYAGSDELARTIPKEDQDRLLDAVAEAAARKRAYSSQGTAVRTGAALIGGFANIGATINRWTGNGLNDEQRKFSHRLYLVHSTGDPIKNPDAPWYDPREWLVDAAGMYPQLAVAGGAGKVAGAGAKVLGAGAKLTGFASGAASAATFAPEMYDATYDSLLEKGVAPSTARWAATASATLQSALFSGLPKTLVPKIGGAESLTKELAESAVKQYAKTVLVHGPSVMAGATAIDAAIQEIAQNKSPEVGKILKDAGATYLKSIGPMAVLALPSAIVEGRISPEKVQEIASRIEQGGAPSRSEAKDLGIPPEEAKSAPNRRAWFEANRERLETEYQQREAEVTKEQETPIVSEEHFQPTEEWKEIPEGVILPPGLEIRMDQASGKNYARKPTAEPTSESPQLEEAEETPEQRSKANVVRDRAVHQYAEERGLDPDAFYSEAELVHQGLRDSYEARQQAKRYAHNLTELSVADVETVANKGFDFSSGRNVPGRRGQKLARFDEVADQIVKQYPEAFTNEDREDPSRAVWDLMGEPTNRKGFHIDDPKVLEEAEAALQKASEVSFDPAQIDEESLAAELTQTVLQRAETFESQGKRYPGPYKPTIKERAQEANKEVLSALDDFGAVLKQRGLYSNAFADPELVSAAGKLTAKLVKAGVLNFADVVNEVGKTFGKPLANRLKPILRAHWDIVSAKFKLPPAEEETTPAVSSVKKWMVDQLRENRGFNPIPDETPEKQRQWLDSAESRMMNDPDYGRRLVNELNVKPRALDQTETAALQIQYRHIQNLYGEAVDKLTVAHEAGDSVAAVSAEAEVARQSGELESIENAARISGRVWGRTGVARKIELAEDFSLAGLTRRAMDAKGGKPLTAEETSEIKQLSERVRELEKQLEKNKYVSRLDEVINGVKSSGTKPISAKKLAVKREIDSAWSELHSVMRDLSSTTFGGIPVSPELVAAAGKIIKGYVKLGVVTFEEFMAAAQSQLGDRAEDLKDAFAAEWENLKRLGEVPTFKIDATNMRAVGRLARRLTRSVVEAGIAEREAVVDAVHRELTSIIPDITRRQAMDAISGYGDYRELSKDEISVKVRDIKGQLQQLAKLDDMAKGEAPMKTGVERRSPSDDERRLLQQVNEAKKKGGFSVTDPGTQLKTALDAAKTAVRNRISDLEQEIATKQKIVKERTSLQADAELQALRAQRDALLDVHKTLFPPAQATDAQRIAMAEKALGRAIIQLEADIRGGKIGIKPKPERLTSPDLEAKRARLEELRAQRDALREAADPNKAYRESLQRQLEEYKRRVVEEDYDKPPKKQLKLNKKEIDLKYQVSEEKKRFEAMREKWQKEQRTTIEKARELVPTTLDTARAIMTSIDLSAVLRQGGLGVASHPATAAKIMPKMLKAAASKKGEFGVVEEIRNRPNAVLYEQAKLGLTDSEAKLTKQEEAYAGSLAKYIPGVAASERAYVSFLNTLRADVFDLLAADLSRTGEATPDEAKIIANYVNVITGRGSLGKAEMAAPALVHVFFAPKFVWSRFQFLAGQPLWAMHGKGSYRVRKLVAKEYARILRGYGVFYGLVAMAGAALWKDDDENKPKLSFDPRSSDFGKVRIGNTTVDPLAGLSQSTVLLNRIAPKMAGTPFGEKTTQHGQIKDTELGAEVGRFLQTKLSPWLGTAFEMRSGQNVVGEKTTLAESASHMVIPLSLRDIYEVMKEQGATRGTALSMLAILGTGMNTYQKRSTGSKTADKVFEAWYAENPHDETNFPGMPSDEYKRGDKTIKMNDAQFETYSKYATEAAGKALDGGIVKLDPQKPSAAAVKWIGDVVAESRSRVKSLLVDRWGGKLVQIDPEKIGKEAAEAKLASIALAVARPEHLSRNDESVQEAQKAIQYAKELGVSEANLADALREKMRRMAWSRDSILAWRRRLSSRIN